MKCKWQNFCSLCLLLLVFVCCNRQKKETNSLVIDKFEKEFTLSGEQILKEDVTALTIYQIDDFILTRQVNQAEYHFNAYNKNTLTFIKSFGLKEGPDSWYFTFYSGQSLKEKDSVKIWLYDFPKGKFIKLNLTGTIYSKSLKPKIDTIIDLGSRAFSANSLFYVNDSIVAGDCAPIDVDRVRLKKINLHTNTIEKSDLFPKVLNINLLTSHDSYRLYISSIGFYNNRFVSAMEQFDRIDFFDTAMQKKLSILGKHYLSDKKLDISDLNLKRDNPLKVLTIYYSGIELTDKYIYALYYNQPGENYGKPKPVEIRVFNWEGTPKFLIHIPDYLMDISVDEQEGFIYGVAFFEEKIMRYNIKHIIH